MDSGAQLCRAVALNRAIEDARNKKKTLDANVQSIINLREEVERREKAAEEAKKEADECSLNLVAKIEQLKQMEQRGKETNDMHAKEVHAQKAALATAMEDLEFRASGMLNEGDESLATLEEIRYSLEKRLASTIIKREAADKEKLEKEVAFAYQKIQMEKMLEASKRLEQEAMENLKAQEFLMDRRRAVDMLQREISCKCLDVNLLKIELEDYQETSEILRPIPQETTCSKDCEERLLKEKLELYNEDDDDGTEVLEPMIQKTEYSPCDGPVRYKSKEDTSYKSHQKHQKKKATRKLNEEQIIEAVKEYEKYGRELAALHGRRATSYKTELKDSQKKNEISMPIPQETTRSQDCEERLLKEKLELFDDDATEDLEPIIQKTEYSPYDSHVRYKSNLDTSYKSHIKHQKKKASRKLNEELIIEAVEEYKKKKHGCEA